MPIAVSREEVAALFGWYLRKPTEEAVVESFRARCKLHTNSAAGSVRKSAGAASAIVAFASDILARAFTDVNIR
jgi:hypothetical protein